MQGDIERRTMRKIFWHLMPILTLGSAFNNIDRANIGFAAIRMNSELGLTAAQFGSAAGIFYVSYVLFCIPGNLIGSRLGLRKWLPIMMVAWGVCSMATGLATSATGLRLVRLLLGATESGFVPGALFLIGLWVPDAYRGRFVSWFWLAASVGAVISSPLSTYILSLDAFAGLRSWQLLFIAEAAPVCLFGLVGFWFLPDDPVGVKWLSQEERNWLIHELGRASATQVPFAVPDLHELLRPRIVLLSLVYFFIMMMGVSFSFFLPSYLSSRGMSLTEIGAGLVLVHLMGIGGHRVWGIWSDYLSHNRQFVCFAAALTVTASLSLLPWVSGVTLITLVSCIAQMGLAGAYTSFWPIPMAAVRASAAAGVLTGITMIGNLTGLIGPYLTGLLRDRTNSYVLSFTMLASCMALAGGLVLAGRCLKSGDATADLLA
jgi:MFS transporter, ACS family, tartrate transporter